MIFDRAKLKNSGKMCPSSTLSTSPTWTDLGANLGLYCERLATNTALAMAWCRKHVGFEPPHLRWRRCYGIWKVFRICIVARM
jgi:hypothetical protein